MIDQKENLGGYDAEGKRLSEFDIPSLRN